MRLDQKLCKHPIHTFLKWICVLQKHKIAGYLLFSNSRSLTPGSRTVSGSGRGELSPSGVLNPMTSRLTKGGLSTSLLYELSSVGELLSSLLGVLCVESKCAWVCVCVWYGLSPGIDEGGDLCSRRVGELLEFRFGSMLLLTVTEPGICFGWKF